MMTLKDICKAKGLSFKALSEMSGVGLPQISRIENGKANPRKATLEKLAKALRVDMTTLERAIFKKPAPLESFSSWKFLNELDGDLRSALLQKLVSSWTHHSTSLEGNTINEGETHLIITEGLTVSGKSLREHQEVHGHAEAVRLISEMVSSGLTLTIERCHELHRMVQTELIFDIYNPVGRFKKEINGTQALRSSGESFWHEYARPELVPFLMDQWRENFQLYMRKTIAEDHALEIYTEIFLWFAEIHPYADGNGRLARLLANVPLLRSGHPPVIVYKESRMEYLGLLGDYSSVHPALTRESSKIDKGREFQALRDFFQREWDKTREIIYFYQSKQKERL